MNERALRERVFEAEDNLHRVQQRNSAVVDFMWPGEASTANYKKHASVAAEHTLRAQSNHLQVLLDASYQRAELLERRLQERQVHFPPSMLPIIVTDELRWSSSIREHSD